MTEPIPRVSCDERSDGTSRQTADQPIAHITHIPEPRTPETGARPAPNVPRYLPFAVLATFLCPPIGMMSIIYSSRVSDRLSRHDIAGAYLASRRCLTWCVAALVLGIPFLLLLVAASAW